MPAIITLGESCCGCGACAAVCPKGCVTMKADALGFLHPSVDADVCVACGCCDKICPIINHKSPDTIKEVRWVRAVDDDLLLRSSSGGMFGLLAQNTFGRGGAVYGAAFSADFSIVRHVRVDSPYELDTVMRSKYVQSVVGMEVYRGVESDLYAGSSVLFCGTACQISGMQNYLEARRVPINKLTLVDVICHGVPSPELWRCWLAYRESLAGGRICGMNFRSKTTGWSSYSVRYEYHTEKDEVPCIESVSSNNDWYMKAFLSNASLRSSCLKCSVKRSCGSDLTLGDFWGVSEHCPEAFDDRGVSAVIANTDAGRQLLRSVTSRAEMGPSSYVDVFGGNLALAAPARPYYMRKRFLDEFVAGVDIGSLERRWNFKPALHVRAYWKLRNIAKKMLGRG